MLLALDLGNSSLSVGTFDGPKLVKRFAVHVEDAHGPLDPEKAPLGPDAVPMAGQAAPRGGAGELPVADELGAEPVPQTAPGVLQVVSKPERRDFACFSANVDSHPYASRRVRPPRQRLANRLPSS